MLLNVKFGRTPEFIVSQADIPPSPNAQWRAPPIEVVPDVTDVAAAVVAISPDGARLAYGANFDQHISLLDLAADKRLRKIRIDSGVKALRFSADGASLLLVDGNKLKQIDIETGAVTSNLSVIETSDRPLSVSSAAFSHDGSHVAVSEYGHSIAVIEFATGKISAILHHSEERGRASKISSFGASNTSPLAMSADGAWLLSGSEDGTVNLWERKTAKLLQNFNAHSKQVQSVGISADGTRLLTGGADGEMKLWDSATGQLMRTFAHGGKTQRTKSIEVNFGVNVVSFSPEGNLVISAGYGGAKIWNSTSGDLIREIRANETLDEIMSIAFLPDKDRIVLGTRSGQIMHRDMNTNEVLYGVRPLLTGGHRVSYAPDGVTLLSSGGGSGIINRWDANTDRLLNSINTGEDAVKATLSPDGRHVLSWGETMKVWDASTGRLVQTFDVKETTCEPVFSSDGRTVAACPGNILRIAEVSTGRNLKDLRGHATGINSLALVPGGWKAITGGYDDTLRIWDLKTGKTLHKIAVADAIMISSVEVAPDGLTFVEGGFNGTIQLRSVATGELMRTFSANGERCDCGPADTAEDNSSIIDLKFSPDGAKLISAHSSGYLTLWDVATSRRLRRFATAPGFDYSVAFSPDGARIAAGGGDSTVKIWNIADGAQISSLYATTENEWLTLTPAGFFANSLKGTDFLNIVRGVEPFSVMQFYDHLRRPDLVEEALKGDREGTHKDAARRLNLDSVLKSGPAPHIELLPNRTEKAGHKVKLVLRIIDAGGGIGSKIIWRVNGTTQGDITAPGLAGEPDPGRYAIMQQSLTVDPEKRNEIEVVAYNHEELLASPPYRLIMDPFGVTLDQRPRLFVLAVGVDDYAKADWRLRYAANDALALGQALKSVGAAIFETVEITSLLNGEATQTGIDAAFERLSGKIKPRDVFVLFLGGHGRSIMGSGWFFLPPDLTLDGRQNIEANGIGQDKWQKWLARIAASKSVLILDACESGATEGFSRQRPGTRNRNVPARTCHRQKYHRCYAQR